MGLVLASLLACCVVWEYNLVERGAPFNSLKWTTSKYTKMP